MLKTVYKSAVTGEFVTKEYAEENPNTTYRTEIEVEDEAYTEPLDA